MGWEPAEVTTFVYEGDRLVRTVTVREPEFDRPELVLLLASRRSRTNQFGIPLHEATDPAAAIEQRFQGYAIRDYSEKEYHEFKEWYFNEHPNIDKNGLAFGVRRITSG